MENISKRGWGKLTKFLRSWNTLGRGFQHGCTTVPKMLRALHSVMEALKAVPQILGKGLKNHWETIQAHRVSHHIQTVSEKVAKPLLQRARKILWETPGNDCRHPRRTAWGRPGLNCQAVRRGAWASGVAGIRRESQKKS